MTTEQSAYLAVVVHNLGLFALIGLAVYFTSSAWPMVGLLAVTSTKTTKEKI